MALLITVYSPILAVIKQAAGGSRHMPFEMLTFRSVDEKASYRTRHLYLARWITSFEIAS